jgi:AraC-like DNA-binding protein
MIRYKGKLRADEKDCIPGLYLYKRIVQSKLFIDRHFAEPINLEDMAGEAFFSRFHFIRLFKKAYHCTPHRYLVLVRIENAGRLLREGAPVRHACFDSGFESITSFTGLFRRFNRQTPAAYREYWIRRKRAQAATPLHFIPGCFANRPA